MIEAALDNVVPDDELIKEKHQIESFENDWKNRILVLNKQEKSNKFPWDFFCKSVCAFHRPFHAPLREFLP